MLNRRELLAAALAAPALPLGKLSKNAISIRGDMFLMNGKPTYPGRTWKGHRIEGLLMNTRMVQGIYHDENPETVSRWKYPDTGKWDPERNTAEFIAAMPEWRKHGVLSFTICLQGGSPEGYSKSQPWRNSALRPDGTLKKEMMARLKRILDQADTLGMAPIVGIYYFGQDEHLKDDEAVKRGVREATTWLLAQGYRNVLLEIANECDNRAYQQPLIQAPRIHELIDLAKSIQVEKRRLLVGASFNGNSIPTANVVKSSDFILMHGNGVKEPTRIQAMVEAVRKVPGYRPMPVVFNEDDHFDFDKPANNMVAAISAYASWGYFDPEGYQSPPVKWGLDTPRKKAFFQLVKEVTGA